jgi:hypothetical protein
MYSVDEPIVTESMSAGCPFSSCGNDDVFAITTYLGRVEDDKESLVGCGGLVLLLLCQLDTRRM